jgi:hypothetical protein
VWEVEAAGQQAAQLCVNFWRLDDACTCSGRKKEIIDDEKQRMWEAQQEVLRARRSGKSLDGVTERRAKAKQAVRTCPGADVTRHRRLHAPCSEADVTYHRRLHAPLRYMFRQLA